MARECCDRRAGGGPVRNGNHQLRPRVRTADAQLCGRMSLFARGIAAVVARSGNLRGGRVPLRPAPPPPPWKWRYARGGEAQAFRRQPSHMCAALGTRPYSLSPSLLFSPRSPLAACSPITSLIGRYL